jgi:hypothetical protein
LLSGDSTIHFSRKSTIWGVVHPFKSSFVYAVVALALAALATLAALVHFVARAMEAAESVVSKFTLVSTGGMPGGGEECGGGECSGEDPSAAIGRQQSVSV